MSTEKNILMVDDVSTNLKCVAEVLGDTYKVSMVKSGKQALQFLQKEKPDLILLDINMPDLNGYEILETLRDNKDYKNIPVMILTADNDKKSSEKAIQLGAVDYITKPFEPLTLLSRIDAVISKQS